MRNIKGTQQLTPARPGLPLRTPLWMLLGLWMILGCALRSGRATPDKQLTATGILPDTLEIKQPFGRTQLPAVAPQGISPAQHSPGRRPPLLRLDYADSFLPLNEQVREFERDPANRYTYCVRAVATYECLSYGADGEIRRQQSRAVSHGTAFAYREQAGETLLLTNAHVSTWPQVTDARRVVTDIPAGCKLVTESLHIVDNENDDFSADDSQLTRVALYEEMDAAIVKTHAKLRVIPYRTGKSAILKAGDVVLVRGFPLGAFQAYNTGKVVNPYDLDTYKEWNHADFIIDAPLSSGNSGSPVLALSSRTGEYELVGLFHASYARANSLNAVVGIDQLREFMVQLKRPQGGVGGSEGARGTARRAELEQAILDPGFVPYLALGSLTVSMRMFGKSFFFEIFSRRFPLDDQRALLLLDQAAPDGAGSLSRIYFGNERGYKAQELTTLGADEQRRLAHTLQRLYALAASTVRFRSLSKKAAAGREAMAERATLQRALAREAAGDQDLAQLLLDLAERLGPHPADEAVSYPAVVTALSTPAGPAIALTPTPAATPLPPADKPPGPPPPPPPALPKPGPPAAAPEAARRHQ